jgi:hypothetical protein
MGVAVARFMVGAMGGRLAVGQRPATEALYAFTIDFPVLPSPPPPRRPTHVSLVGLPALVVSEDPVQRGELTALLRGWRMVPMEADNASMALKFLERLHDEGSPVPLVLVSNRLAVQDGFLLAFRIRHHDKLAPTLVMMLATPRQARRRDRLPRERHRRLPARAGVGPAAPRRDRRGDGGLPRRRRDADARYPPLAAGAAPRRHDPAGGREPRQPHAASRRPAAPPAGRRNPARSPPPPNSRRSRTSAHRWANRRRTPSVTAPPADRPPRRIPRAACASSCSACRGRRTSR